MSDFHLISFAISGAFVIAGALMILTALVGIAEAMIEYRSTKRHKP